MLYGLTDQGPGLPAGGVLKKGDEKGEKRAGNDLQESFRFEGKGNLAHKRRIEAAFRKYYGERPTAIRVQLVHPGASQNFDAWAEAYGSGNWLKVKCDRREQVRWYNGSYYETTPKPCQFDRASGKCPLGCDEIGRLTVWIPELFREGFYQPITVQTHSLNDISSLDEQMKYYDTLVDDIRGVTFTLQRKSEEHHRPGFDKAGNRTEGRGKMTSWFLELIPPVDWLEQQLTMIAMDRERLVDSNTEPTNSLGKPPAVGYEENEIEIRAGQLSQITGCPYKNLNAIARSEFHKSVHELSEEEYRKLRSLIFLQWGEMGYGFSRNRLIELLRKFLNTITANSDEELFSLWKGFVQNVAVNERIESH